MFETFVRNRSFDGQYVAVLGGAGLLGASIVEGLAAFNACPLIVDIDVNRSRDVVAKIVSQGGKAEFYEADMSKVEDIMNIVDDIEGLYGPINNWALSSYPKTNDWGVDLEEITTESWRKNVDTQMNCVCVCASGLAKRMSRRGGGSIVTIGSIYGIVAPSFDIYDGMEMTSPAAYSAIKGGISAFSRYLASYYGKNNVRVNTVIPGGIYNGQPDAFVERYSKLTCQKRMATPAEVSNTVIFLLSDAASYITGIDLPVDGGFLAL